LGFLATFAAKIILENKMRTRPAFFSTVLSMALVLLLLGFLGHLIIYGREIITIFKERVDIWVELRTDATQNDKIRLEGVLKSKNFVRAGSVAFISRADAAHEMQIELGDTSMLADLPNLMYDIFRFNVSEKWLETDSLATIRTEIKQDSLVSDVFYEQTNTANIGKNLKKLGWLVFAIGILFIFVAVTLLHNTIRLALFSNRFLIKNQEMVGATWSFIARPYIYKGAYLGLISAILAILGLLLLRYFAFRQMPALRDFENISSTTLLFGGLILIGILIAGLSSWAVVRKFLGTRLDDLY
jgi:cell division transport system permease protein